MKPQDEAFERKIVAALDAGAADLRAGAAYRLQHARAAALARLQPEAARELRLTPAFAGGASASRGGRPAVSRPALWFGLALAVVLAIGYQQWRAWQQVVELEEVDTAILTSDLPIDAYLDRGFQNWLKHLEEE